MGGKRECQNNSKIDWPTIINDFNRLCPSLPSVKGMSEERKANIKLRLSEHPDTSLTEVFERVEKSDFLTGRTKDPWRGCSFDWIIKKANYIKIIEGNYDNKGKTIPGQSWENEQFMKTALEIKDID
jgi:hypothetical protein